jgi:hypothetical protein
MARSDFPAARVFQNSKSITFSDGWVAKPNGFPAVPTVANHVYPRTSPPSIGITAPVT